MPIYRTAGDILDTSAALQNDTDKQVYTYLKQFPYLKIALRDFEELAQLNNIPVTNKISTVLTVPGSTVALSDVTSPALPTDLVEIQQLWESTNNSSFVPMSRVDFLNPNTVNSASYGAWSWQGNEIKLPSVAGIVYLKIDYISTLFSSIADENSPVQTINADSFLQYRTAGLCAQYIGENKERADDLNGNAALALDRILGIENKARQGVAIRHRPFRASYKSRM